MQPTDSQHRASRRRFLKIAAATAVGTLLPPAVLAAPALHSGRGVLLGADAEIQLYHPDGDWARVVIGECFAAVRRLEAIFSLQQADSALARLNASGSLAAPPAELLALLTAAQGFASATGGAFDVTVQPLWRLYADYFGQPDADAGGPPPVLLEAALALVDYRQIRLTPERVALGRPGMAVTLNGIAQGFITDRVTEMLRARGFRNVLVNMGETRALGAHADGSPWRVGLADPELPWRSLLDLPLVDRALATSGGYGTPFEPTGRHHHLFDPRSGRSANHYRSVSVQAPDATTADALSTGLSVLPPDEAFAVLEGYRGVSAYFLLPDGRLLSRDA